MKTGIVIYASRYGSTQEYARVIGDGLDFSILDVSDAESRHFTECGLALPVVLGSPIYGYSVLPEMAAFLDEHGSKIFNRLAGAFVVCGDTLWIPKAGEGGFQNLEKLTSLLPEAPAATAVFGGRMIIDQLSAEDHNRILAFYERLDKEPIGFDRMDLSAVGPFVEEVRQHME